MRFNQSEDKNLCTSYVNIISQKDKVQTKYGNLDATKCIPTTWHKPKTQRVIHMILPIANVTCSKACSPRNRGTLVWAKGAVFLHKALFCFVWNLFSSIIVLNLHNINVQALDKVYFRSHHFINCTMEQNVLFNNIVCFILLYNWWTGKT